VPAPPPACQPAWGGCQSGTSAANIVAAANAIMLCMQFMEWEWLSVDKIRRCAGGEEFHVQWKQTKGQQWEDSWEPESSFVCRWSLWHYMRWEWLPQHDRSKFAQQIKHREATLTAQRHAAAARQP
jgi:hypothetical protein